MVTTLTQSAQSISTFDCINSFYSSKRPCSPPCCVLQTLLLLLLLSSVSCCCNNSLPYSDLVLSCGTNRSIEIFDVAVGKSVSIIDDVHTRPGTLFVKHFFFLFRHYFFLLLYDNCCNCFFTVISFSHSCSLSVTPPLTLAYFAVHTICMNQSTPYVTHQQESYDLFLTASTDSSLKLWDLRTQRYERE